MVLLASVSVPWVIGIAFICFLGGFITCALVSHNNPDLEEKADREIDKLQKKV